MRASSHASSLPPPSPKAPPKLPVDPTPIGTLWILPGSPFSGPVKVVLALSNRTVRKRSYIPLLSTLAMYFRLGLSAFRTKLTFPILRLDETPARYLRDSFDIAVHIDSQRRPAATPTLFPPAFAARIAHFNVCAATLNSHIRARLIVALRADLATAARMFAPPLLRHFFLIRPFIWVALWLLARKYRDDAQAASREAAVAALEDVRAALASYEGARLRYVCGGRLTYADIVVAESLYFDPERHRQFAHLLADKEFLERFPDLVAWAHEVRATHYRHLVTYGERKE